MDSVNIKDLTRDLGGHWQHGYGTAPCPCCQPERRRDQTALTIGESAGRLLLHCKKSGCSFTDLLAACGITPGGFELDMEAIAEAAKEKKEAEARAIRRAMTTWERSKPITGTRGEDYLRGRGITCALPESLRWVDDIRHTPSGKYCEALVARVDPTGAIHRTFFEKKGPRLTTNPKMMLGPCRGGAVRLSGGPGPLVACEGIETGLSLLSGILDGPAQAWAALSTSGLQSLELPREPGELIVATDGDKAGRAAGNTLASSAHAAGWEVSMLRAPDGKDWNDVLQQEALV
ncbi:MAG: toprim domain-containing protein [Paracoccaceae bacterium]